MLTDPLPFVVLSMQMSNSRIFALICFNDTFFIAFLEEGAKAVPAKDFVELTTDIVQIC